MKAKFFGIPAAIIGGVLLLWWYLSTSNASAAKTVPNTAASGVPQWTPAIEQYSINPPTMTPSPLATLNPFIEPTGSASYLQYNRPPSHDLDKTPPVNVAKKDDSCGCDSGCGTGCADNNSQYTDGQGSVCMTTSPKHQINDLGGKYPDLWQKYADNLKSAGVEFTMVPDDLGGGSLGSPVLPRGRVGLIKIGEGVIGQTVALLPRGKDAFELLHIPYGPLTVN